ncbi:Aldo/keto reductase [Mycena sp. CBHHK59/15]|nr:Aldo/keto reductase [Mycena sp. CBHHK59/15]
MSFPTRKIAGVSVSAIGFGAMGIAGRTVLDAAYAAGCTMWDTADVYGDSEELFKRTGKRDEIFLASKFGFIAFTGRVIDGTPEYARKAVEKSLQRLGVDCIDLYYLHVPPQHTVRAMAEFVKEGKVKYLGLSEVSAATLRRAHAVHPITAVQVEYSPFTLDIEDPKIALLQTCRELGIATVAYSPLGRGLLRGSSYNATNFPNILKIADGLTAIGTKYGATSSQVALAWLLAQGADVIPIPGTKKIKYLEENLGAVKVVLSAEDVAAVRKLAVDADAQQGERYPPGLVEVMFVDTPVLE